MSSSRTIAELQAAVRQFSDDRDWGRYHSPRNLAMSVSVEAGELLELFLWSTDDGPQPAVDARVPRVAEEAADVLISLLNLCDRAGIDLSAAVDAKLKAAAEKYPVERVRGRALKYDEYPEWNQRSPGSSKS
jgi:dCTP diphosphatase